MTPRYLVIGIIFYGLIFTFSTLLNYDSNTNIANLNLTIGFNTNLWDLFGILSSSLALFNLIGSILLFSTGNWLINTFLWIFRIIMSIELLIWIKRLIHPTLV